MKIKAGIENMLILYNSMKRDPVALNEVQSQLNAAIQRTEQLTQELDQLLGERTCALNVIFGSIMKNGNFLLKIR